MRAPSLSFNPRLNIECNVFVVGVGLTHWQHPSFFAYFPTACTFEGMLGDLYASSATNPGFNVRPLCCNVDRLDLSLHSGSRARLVLSWNPSSWIGLQRCSALILPFTTYQRWEEVSSRCVQIYLRHSPVTLNILSLLQYMLDNGFRLGPYGHSCRARAVPWAVSRRTTGIAPHLRHDSYALLRKEGGTRARPARAGTRR